MTIKPRVLNSANPKTYRRLYKAALKMKNNPTIAEKLLWQVLKLRPMGYKFRSQRIIDTFIVDFYCVKKGLIIEVDGKIHENQKLRDKEREARLLGLECIIIKVK